MEFYTTENPNFKQWQRINDDLKCHLEMDKHGWAYLFFDYQGKYYHIALSDVFDPFQDFIHWIDEVAQNYPLATFEIDEEGHSAELSAMFIENNKIKFSVKSVNYDEPYFFTIVDHQKFIKAFQTEVKRFFSQDFDPLHWDKRGYDEDDEKLRQVGLKEWVLNHEWQ